MWIWALLVCWPVVNFGRAIVWPKWFASALESDYRRIKAHTSVLRGDLERTLVWPKVTFERTMDWSEFILCAKLFGQLSEISLSQVVQKSEQWSDFGLIRGHFPPERSDQAISSALRTHTRFRAAHQSDEWSLRSGMVWPEVTLVWNGLIKGHYRVELQPGTHANTSTIFYHTKIILPCHNCYTKKNHNF